MWFDESCLYIGHRNKDLSKHLNVLCEEIFIDVTIKNVSKELIFFLKRNVIEIVDEDKKLKQDIEELDEKVYSLCLKAVNRFIVGILKDNTGLRS